jgi:D-xylose 1-dehydrogenase (NADP+, D-xylono-1,5-lactone-forming)
VGAGSPGAVCWGFLGAGSIARSSLGPAVRAGFPAVLHAVASTDIARARDLGPRIAYGSYEELLADPDVDVVYVALHNSAHLHWTLAALGAGKHVLCEKPLGLSVEEVDRVAASSLAHDRLLVEACWNRWHPRTRETETLLERGAVGEVRHVAASFDGAVPSPGNYRLQPALGGGALYDVGCYAVAAALTTVGWRPVIGVEACVRLHSESGVDTLIEARLLFEGGGVADILAGLTGSGVQRLDVTGRGGVLRFDQPAFTAGAEATRLHIETEQGSTTRDYPRVDPYGLMVEAMSSATLGVRSYLVPLWQSRAVAAAMDAIRQAADLRPWTRDVREA